MLDAQMGGITDWTTEQAQSAESLIPYFLGPVPAVANLLLGGVHSNADMSAINDYMVSAQPITPEATNALADWTQWWAQLDWYDKNISTSAYDTARNKFNTFVVANQPTAQGKADVQQTLAQGITTEEMSGQPKRADASGNFPQAKPIPKWKKYLEYGALALGGTVLIGVALGVTRVVSNPFALLKNH